MAQSVSCSQQATCSLADIDEVYTLPHIVRPGETISSASYSRKAGGKGANQAYALAKAGAAADLDSNVGQDGLWIAGELRAAGVGTESVSVHPEEVSVAGYLR